MLHAENGFVHCVLRELYAHCMLVQVTAGFDVLCGPGSNVERFPRVGLAVLCVPEPLHYTALFSHTWGADTVLVMYVGQRYEVSHHVYEKGP